MIGPLNEPRANQTPGRVRRANRDAEIVQRYVLEGARVQLARRCAMCLVRCETLEHCRFGNVCSKCHDAVFRMYHYRAPRLSDEQARRILDNLWRNTEDFGFGGDGWKNG
jgi:hypothetical protein